MNGRYDDIFDLPHHVSERHPRMAIRERAAQFSPFAALTGYDAAVRETARLTEARRELAEDAKTQLDTELRKLADRVAEHPKIRVKYYKPDSRKAGGAYVCVDCKVKKVDGIRRALILFDDPEIPFEDIVEITDAEE